MHHVSSGRHRFRVTAIVGSRCECGVVPCFLAGRFCNRRIYKSLSGCSISNSFRLILPSTQTGDAEWISARRTAWVLFRDEQCNIQEMPTM
jgi:hypothetical protein